MLDCTPCARNCSEYFAASSENYRRGVAVLKSYMRKLRLRNLRIGCSSNAVRFVSVYVWGRGGCLLRKASIKPEEVWGSTLGGAELRSRRCINITREGEGSHFYPWSSRLSISHKWHKFHTYDTGHTCLSDYSSQGSGLFPGLYFSEPGAASLVAGVYRLERIL